ncbi:hypothetical protein SAMN05444747_11110 [Variovorax sp. OV329]|nr:hypothetical protein SAMN05444747_11110 [Variovorax sp. OV329]
MHSPMLQALYLAHEIFAAEMSGDMRERGMR